MEHERIEPDKVELSHRRAHGTAVFLYWHQSINALTVAVTDEKLGTTTEFGVPNDQGNDAFYHPYAHMPAQQPVGANVEMGTE